MYFTRNHGLSFLELFVIMEATLERIMKKLMEHSKEEFLQRKFPKLSKTNVITGTEEKLHEATENLLS